MKGLHAFLGSVFTVLAVSQLAAQAPVLSSIQAPYANLQSQVKMAGATYGVGAVAYGPAGTPLTLGGSNFGSTGTVQFVPYANGVAGSPVSATVTTWTSTILSVKVPAGASSGRVTVTVGGATSNGLPFVVMQGTYSASCPAGPPNNQLQIVTSGLANGTAGQAYSETLQATGGTEPYTWAITSGSLPDGLSLDASTGVISGTPTAASGPTSLTLQVTDASSPNQTNSVVLSLTVNGSGSPTTIYSYNSIVYDGVGNVTSYSDSVNGQWSMITSSGGSGYDTLNRLVGAQATAGPYYSSQAPIQATWSYDNFGNRKTENFSGTPSAPVPIPPSSSVTYNTDNQVTSVNGGSGFAYDTSGDVMQDTDNQYLYDADGRICASYNMISHIMTGYLYDAEGNRIAKGPITSLSCDTSSNGFGATGSDSLYILGPSGEQLTEMNWSSGTALYGYTNVSAAGQLIGSYTPGSGSQVALNFQLRDWLGTLRVETDSGGTAQENCESLPYGNGETCVATTPYLFTGKERDTESGNDYFGARYYASSMGRFLSPDWSDGSDPDPVPYADYENPQSLNLYSYVGNNPLTNIDSDGHYHCDPDTSTTTTDSDGNTTVAVTAGACHYDWDDFVNFTSQIAQQATNTLSTAAHQTANYLTAPRNPGCMATMAGGGAAAGAFAGGALGGLGGGAGGTLVAPGVGTVGGAWAGAAAGATEGAGLGGAAGTGVGFFACASGSGGVSGGGGSGGSSARSAKKLSTSRADEAARKAGYAGAEDLKKAFVGEHGSQYDLYAQPNGDVEIFAKGGVGEGIETGINLKN